uniref:AlNc14C8G1070 protein n=1 Tax=Albugo laibachii Nc14 TaxID=890382 RepID=F0W1Z1_9STRA|nr:AlNc14C8G1070 [Albugo laibachii Nc14]|eukprot:CCA15070.1 AlNc14C8G1070 [Albugo laibachii Nc14]
MNSDHWYLRKLPLHDALEFVITKYHIRVALVRAHEIDLTSITEARYYMLLLGYTSMRSVCS